MVDFQSQYRLYGLGYTALDIKEALSKRRHQHNFSRSVHTHYQNIPVHDCQPECVKEFLDPKDWEAHLLAIALKESNQKVGNMYTPAREQSSRQNSFSGGKKLFEMGTFGSGSGNFKYPRSITASRETFNVIVADSQNHCIKFFNQCGVYKYKYGKKGTESKEFNEPTGVCELPNGDIAIADRRNKRIQVFTSETNFKFQFSTTQEPFAIACNANSNIIVSTVFKRIEVYDISGNLLHVFSIDGKSAGASPVQICVNKRNEIIVCDPNNCDIKIYSLSGYPLYKFKPDSNFLGQAVIPSGVCLNSMQQIIVADSLNHTVNLYSEKGIFMEQIVGPVDEVGSVQAVACGNEGHLLTSEFSISGKHCIKIFRYLECQCHKYRPPSHKCTPNSDYPLSL